MKTEILRTQSIAYSYDDEGRAALRGLSAAFYAGERVAVLGRNGAGKSTFFLCCNGVLRPASGSLLLGGKPVGDKAADRMALRRAVGLVFQDPDSQFIEGSVEADVSFGPMNLRLPEEEVRRRVERAIRRLGLEDLRRRAPHTLSGGEKKRVSIADVLAMEPSLLLLDEPFASLDPENALRLEGILDDLSQAGLGLVVATHDVDFAWRWAQRILVFRDGELRADADPETVFADHGLLAECGLEQPILYRVGKRLGLSPLPRMVEEIPTCETN